MSAPVHPPVDSLGEEFAAIPISQAETSASIQLCVVVRRQADPVSGPLVLLRLFPGGRVLLGCLRDGGGRVCAWLELWFQLPLPGEGATGGNAAADERWHELAAALSNAEPSHCWTIPEQERPALPTWLNLAQAAPWHPNREGRPLRVCTNDHALSQRGLPAYSLSQARYGWIPELGGESPLVPLTAECPGGAEPLPSEAVTFVPLNPGGGRMLVRTFSPITAEAFAALLGGVPWAGPDHAVRHCRLSGPYLHLSDAAQLRYGGRHYFSAQSGMEGRLVETLHLKLQLAAQCMKLVRAVTARVQRPLLNLSAESFRVSLAPGDLELPLLWSGTVSLVQPGAALAVPLPSTQTRCFRLLEPPRESIYRPEELSRRRKGFAQVRISRILPPDEDGIVIEATLVTPEDLRSARHELLELALPLSICPVTLYGAMDEKSTTAYGEVAFRTVPQQFTPAELAALQGAAGTILSSIPLEVQAPLSSPCDLYSLGVLTLQILFAGSRLALPVIKDVLFSLAARLRAAEANPAGLAAAVTDLLEKETPWREALNPRHLLAADQADDRAPALLPPGLWAEVLALLLRLFPARSPFAFCRNLADAPPLALETVYNAPLGGLHRLLRLTRSIHLLDWQQNREIVGLIRAAGGRN